MAGHVAVLGAGIVGVSTALALRRAGFEVTLVDPHPPGGEQAASFGNAAWLSPASVVPMSMPGLWRKVPGMLVDPRGPVAIRWSSLPHLAPWLLRFVAAGATVARVEATARALRILLEPGPTLHAEQAAAAGVPELIRRDGLVYAYPTRRAFEAEALAWRLRRDNGVDWSELDDKALHRAVPALSRRYGFGILVAAGGHCRDPGAYVAALARHAEASGARHVSARAIGFRIARGRLAAVATDAGALPCDRAVVCAGIRSGALARAAGDATPLASERGYHVEIADPGIAPGLPVMPSDGRMGTTPTCRGLRAAGQVELCRTDAPPDWCRADILLDHLKRTYVGLPADLPEDSVSRWMGHRPSTPDGLPVIGPSSASPDIVHAFGHGHVGLASAPMTAKLVVEILEGGASGDRLRPYSPRRFRGSWRI